MKWKIGIKVRGSIGSNYVKEAKSGDDKDPITAGIVADTDTTKALILTAEDEYILTSITESRESSLLTGEKALSESAKEADISVERIDRVIATGSEAAHISFANNVVPESLCLARGIECLFPSVGTLVDLRTRKSVVLKCRQGKVAKVSTSGKCASGSVANLKMMAKFLRIDDVDSLNDLYFLSKKELEIHSPCAVFAESEAISLIHNGAKPEDVVKGFLKGLAGKICSQIYDVGIEGDVAVVGDGAHSRAMLAAIKKALGVEVLVPEQPDLVDALGAAMIAREKGDN